MTENSDYIGMGSWLPSEDILPYGSESYSEAQDWAIDVLVEAGYSSDDTDDLNNEVGDHLQTILMMLFARSPKVAALLPTHDTYPSLPHEQSAPELYLVCDDCGEVFSDVKIAREHLAVEDPDLPDGAYDTQASFRILPEHEAF